MQTVNLRAVIKVRIYKYTGKFHFRQILNLQQVLMSKKKFYKRRILFNL